MLQQVKVMRSYAYQLEIIRIDNKQSREKRLSLSSFYTRKKTMLIM